MKRIEAEFAPERLPPRWLWGGALTLLALSAISLAWAASEFRSAEIELAEAQAALVGARKAADDAESLRRQSAGQPLPFEASARHWQVEEVFAWPDALRVLEQVRLEGVVLQSFEATAESQVIRIVIDATDHATIARYADALNLGTSGKAQGAWRWRIVSTSQQPGYGTTMATIEAASLPR